METATSTPNGEKGCWWAPQVSKWGDDDPLFKNRICFHHFYWRIFFHPKIYLDWLLITFSSTANCCYQIVVFIFDSLPFFTIFFVHHPSSSPGSTCQARHSLVHSVGVRYGASRAWERQVTVPRSVAQEVPHKSQVRWPKEGGIFWYYYKYMYIYM